MDNLRTEIIFENGNKEIFKCDSTKLLFYHVSLLIEYHLVTKKKRWNLLANRMPKIARVTKPDSNSIYPMIKPHVLRSVQNNVFDFINVCGFKWLSNDFIIICHSFYSILYIYIEFVL